MFFSKSSALFASVRSMPDTVCWVWSPACLYRGLTFWIRGFSRLTVGPEYLQNLKESWSPPPVETEGLMIYGSLPVTDCAAF